MNVHEERASDWATCDGGYLTQISTRRKSLRRRRAVVRRVGASAVLACLLVGIVWGVSSRGGDGGENYFGGIACSEVRDNMQGYMAGELPEELERKVETHLAHCPRCQELMEKMQGGAGPQVAEGSVQRRFGPHVAASSLHGRFAGATLAGVLSR